MIIKNLNRNMSDPIISINNLSFSYDQKHRILNNLSIKVPKGSIYGFLGPNGAGKSTTLRNILGLLKPQEGEVQIFGKSLKGNRKNLMQNIGSLIEEPSLYGHLSAYDNLKIACRYLRLPFSSIDPILDTVKLSANVHKASKKYSTGMKKRLGLALALLRDPDLLILDEPTTGLDPVGIKEFREILTELQQQGKTIMLSSHLLSEIEKVASQVGIIKKGELVFEGNLHDLDVLLKSNIKLLIKLKNSDKAVQLLQSQFQIDRIDHERLFISLQKESEIPALVQKLVNNQIDVYELGPQKSDLEKLFLDITSETT